ncbi:MAG: alpha/beta hydrolase [Acidobacteriota bacterium]|nr:alpha/beta hydrolase [Acidobacteriota bacterium]
MRKFSQTALLIAAGALPIGCATLPVSRSQPVGGASVSYSVAGSGSPTVVMEAGLGDSKASWSGLATRIAPHSRVFTYDRPGYSPSFKNRFESDRDGRRTGQEVATHLRALLREAGQPPPFVLVGHSIGGLYMLAFAKLNPDDVAGIVLVDSRPADFTGACEAADVGLCVPPKALVAMMPRHQKAEVKGIGETETFAPRPADLGDIPITVIAATEPQITGSRALQKLWLEHQEAFARAAANGRYIEAARSSHYVHRQRPGLVADEILRMLDLVRSASERLAANP